MNECKIYSFLLFGSCTENSSGFKFDTELEKYPHGRFHQVGTLQCGQSQQVLDKLQIAKVDRKQIKMISL